MFDTPPAAVTTLIAEWAARAGWAQQDKMCDMAALVIREKPSCVAEIGVYGGRSLLPMVAAVRYNGRGYVYGIDPYDRAACAEGKQPPTEGFWAAEDLELRYRELLTEIARAGLDKWVTVIRERSADAAGRFYAGTIDLLHLDGNHSEEAALADVKTYLPKLKIGGWLWIDDCHWDSVRPAYDIAKESCFVVKEYGHHVLLRRG